MHLCLCTWIQAMTVPIHIYIFLLNTSRNVSIILLFFASSHSLYHYRNDVSLVNKKKKTITFCTICCVVRLYSILVASFVLLKFNGHTYTYTQRQLHRQQKRNEWKKTNHIVMWSFRIRLLTTNGSGIGTGNVCACHRFVFILLFVRECAHFSIQTIYFVYVNRSFAFRLRKLGNHEEKKDSVHIWVHV